MPNPLIFYQKVRFANIMKYIGKLAQAMDAETLHNLRVELKRVRFLKTILAQYEKEQKVQKAYKPFKKLFKKLGEIRSQHVNLYRLSTSLRNGLEPTAQRHFQSKRERLEKKLKENLRKNAENLREGMHAMDIMIGSVNDWDESEFLKTIKKQVRKKINKKTPEKNLHRARHVLKSVVYATELSNNMVVRTSSTFNMKAIVNLEDAIGDWHDLAFLLKGKSGRLLTARAKKQILKKKKAELKRIRQLIPNLLIPKPTPL